MIQMDGSTDRLLGASVGIFGLGVTAKVATDILGERKRKKKGKKKVDKLIGW